jgi:hypothetical protein
METKTESQDSYNVTEITRRIKEVTANFDIKLFNNIVDNYKRKSEVLTDEEIFQREKDFFGLHLNKESDSNPDKRNLNSIFEEALISKRNKFPMIGIEKNANVLAHVNEGIVPGGLIKFNPHQIEIGVHSLINKFRKENISVNFDLIYLILIKVIIHELLHLKGGLYENHLMNEAVLELFSYTVTREYLTQTSTRTTISFNELFETTTFDFYSSEVTLFYQYLYLLAKYTGVDILTVRNGFYRLFLRKERFESLTYCFRLTWEL